MFLIFERRLDDKLEDSIEVNSKKIMVSSVRDEIIIEKSRKTTEKRNIVQKKGLSTLLLSKYST